MWQRVSGLATRLKSGAEWYAIVAVAVGLPTLAMATAYVNGFTWFEMIIVLMFGIAFAVVVVAEGQPTLNWLFRIRARLSDRPNASLLLHDKPDASGKVHLEVTNRGPVGEFYAILEVLHPVSRWPDGMFGRWSHSDLPRVEIARGAHAKICLARLNRDDLVRQWHIPYTTHSGQVNEARHPYSFLLGQPETYSAALVRLKVTLAAKPDMPDGVITNIYEIDPEGVTVHSV
jgi:hypothetical protein